MEKPANPARRGADRFRSNWLVKGPTAGDTCLCRLGRGGWPSLLPGWQESPSFRAGPPSGHEERNGFVVLPETHGLLGADQLGQPSLRLHDVKGRLHIAFLT